MADNSDSCPTRVELSDLLSGRSPVDSAAIIQHLETCPRCAQTAEALSRESDLERMIRTRPPSDVAESPLMVDLMERVRQVVAQQSGDTHPANRLSTTDARKMGGPLALDHAALDALALSVLVPTDQPGYLGELGHYRILKLIGRGGMGVVFLAEDTHLRRQVALKVLMPTRVVDPQQRERFLREARAAAGIKHENVVTVYQVDIVEGPLGPTPYLAMEMLEGVTLDQAIHRGRHFNNEDIRNIGEQIAAGLAAAHAGGLIHRDIKPANVFLGPSDHVKLLDFGLALPMESLDGRLTQDGYLIGTPDYMSPEQAGCMPLDPRSDLFSLGSVLYQLATGKLPFTAKTTTLQLAALLSSSPQPIRNLNPALPEPLAVLVMRLLQRSLSERPASAKEVRERLRTMVLRRSGFSKTLQRNALLVLGILVCCGLIIVVRNRDGSTSRIEAESIESITAIPAGPSGKVAVPAGTLAPFIAPDLDRAWFDRVSKLPALVRSDEVRAELKRRNPGMGDSIQFGITADRIRTLVIDSTVLDDISPLAVLRELQSIRILNSNDSMPLGLTDVRPLQGLKLKEVYLERCPNITDFSSLDGMPLIHFSVYGSPLPDAAWFSRQGQIESLNIGNRSTAPDLNMLKHLPLVGLELNETPAADLAPVAHHRLEMLRLTGTKVSDLSPIVNMPLVRLEIDRTPVLDFEPLRKLDHLTFIRADIRTPQQVATLRSLKNLKSCNQLPLDSLDAYLVKPLAPAIEFKQLVGPNDPIRDWLEKVSKLAPDAFTAEVRRELCRRNPGLENSLELKGPDERITELATGAGFVADLGPVAALTDLRRLRIGYQPAGSQRRTLTDLRPLSGLRHLQDVELEFCPDLRDLTPLYNKPLDRLSLYATPLPDLSWITKSRIRFLNVGGRETPVNLSFMIGSQVLVLECNESETSDLLPLRGLPLQHLSIANTNVIDLAPLRNMPLRFLDFTETLVDDLKPLSSLQDLKRLRCNIRNEQELNLVRSLTSVEEVNGMPRENVMSLVPRTRKSPSPAAQPK